MSDTGAIEVQGQGFKIKVGFMALTDGTPTILELAIGTDCAIVDSYNLYKDVMTIKKGTTLVSRRGGAVFDRSLIASSSHGEWIRTVDFIRSSPNSLPQSYLTRH